MKKCYFFNFCKKGPKKRAKKQEMPILLRKMPPLPTPRVGALSPTHSTGLRALINLYFYYYF
jgi:hypothetical protein